MTKKLARMALNFELSDNELPELIELLPAGEIIQGRDGRRWNNPDPEMVVRSINERGTDLVLDWEHATELKAPAGEQAPAAAWLHQAEVKDGAVVARVRAWTPDGEAAVRNRTYRYISPVFTYDRQTMNVIGITSVGLTNRPNLYLPALNHEQQEDHMLKKILKKLGLPEDATEETALNAIDKKDADLQTALNQARTPPLDRFVPKADYDLALNRATTAEEQLGRIQAEQLQTDIDTAINQALDDGKIAPASKDYYTAMCRTEGGLKKFQAFAASAPKIVAVSDLGGKSPECETALNAELAQVAAMFGNTPEDIAKYGR